MMATFVKTILSKTTNVSLIVALTKFKVRLYVELEPSS